MRNHRTQEGGYIVKVLVIIVALVALKYVFHIDVIEWLKTDTAKNIYMPVWTGIKNLYAWVDGLFRSHVAK